MKIGYPTAKGSVIDRGEQNCPCRRPSGQDLPSPPQSRDRRLVERLLKRSDVVYIPEIGDYELRRELIRARLQESVHRLDRLKSVLNYLPINTEVMLKAAELWAGPPNTRSTSMRSRN